MTSDGSKSARRRSGLKLAASLAGSLVLTAGLGAIVFFVVLGDGGGEAERVARASDAVNAAMEEGNFETLHLLLASEVQESSSAADISHTFGQAETTQGVIVAVKRLREPVVDGERAVVDTEVTYDKGGQTSIKAFYDLYVLENGEWRLVYSQPKEEVDPSGMPGE